MNVLSTALPGVILLEPRVFSDQRGEFFELWSQRTGVEAGLPERFAQANVSRSVRGVLRGLHFQYPHGQGKLVSALEGEIFDVAVDIRVGSPTFGRWVGAVLSSANHKQIYLPEGFAHGFAVLSDSAIVHYQTTDFYNPATEGIIRWDDPNLQIEWPVTSPLLAAKDAGAPLLTEIAPARLPSYEAR